MLQHRPETMALTIPAAGHDVVHLEQPEILCRALDEVLEQVDRERSLEDLERHRWSATPAGATRLVSTVHALRRKPVGELTVEDLRLMIGQDVGLAHLLPRAMELLRAGPLAEGDLYAGDTPESC